MLQERRINYGWVEQGLFELCDTYREQALGLVQKAEDERKNDVLQYLEAIIKEHVDAVNNIMQQSIDWPMKEVINFEVINEEDISAETLNRITNLTSKFKERVLKILRAKSIFQRINDAPFMIAAIMDCIFDMREKLNNM